MNRKESVRRLFSAGLVFCLLLLVFPAQSSAGEPRKITTIEGITEYALDNGLRVLLFSDPSAPKVLVNMTVLVGSRHEGYGETGMAHLLEHMLFKGTPNHPNIPKVLRDHGANYNASTWLDRTNYYEEMPATKENLEFALRLEADRLLNSFVKREDLVSEMTVVRNEFEMGENSPQSILSQRMLAVAYEWHNYGKSTIGNRSDIERVPIENLQQFYRKHYQPDNAVLLVAGKFDEAKALELISKYFGNLKRPVRRLDTTYTDEPAQDGERTVVLRRVGKVGVVGAVYHIPAAAHEDYAALEVLDSILSVPPAGRLYQALVKTKKASSVSTSTYGLHDPGVIEIVAQVNPNVSLESVRDTLIDVLEKLATGKFTAEEVERAKTKLLNDHEKLMNNSTAAGQQLTEWIAVGDWRLFFLHRDRVKKITPDDVARVAKRYLRGTNRTVGLYYPTTEVSRAPIPETPDVAKLLKDYKGGGAVAAGETIEPTPEAIEKRVQRSELIPGIKMAILPKKTRGKEVVLQLRLRYGNTESFKGLTTAADLLGSMLTRGTQKHSRQQLHDELDRLKATMNVSSSLGAVSVGIRCKRAQLPAVLQLLKEVLREPTFPADEFDIIKRQQRSGLEQQLTEPTALAFNAMLRKLSPYPKDDVRYQATIQESLANLEATTVDQVRKLHREQLCAQAGALAIVGDFDKETTTQLIADILKDWKSTTPSRRIKQPANTNVAGERLVIETPDKANAIYIAGHMLAMKDTDPDNAALEIGNFILGGGTLYSRLGNRVRQKEGLSYGVGSQFNADAQDVSAQFMTFAICNPSNMTKVDQAIMEELTKILKNGIDAKELEDAKKAYLEQLKTDRATEGQLANLLQANLQANRTLAYYANLEKQVAALTPAQVVDAMRKHFIPNKLVVIQAGDFKKSKKK